MNDRLEWAMAGTFTVSLVPISVGTAAVLMAPYFALFMVLLGVSGTLVGLILLRVYLDARDRKLEYLRTVKKEWKIAPFAAVAVAVGAAMGSPVFVFGGIGLYGLAFLSDYLD
ncbi:MAG: hypothetical protein JRM77_03355 [Nitrososphaerota archaeon]|nr:hypothetical protein [Nitrososphaerota archaeon]